MLQYASRVDVMQQRKPIVLALYASPDGHEPVKQQSLGLSGLNGLNGFVVAVPLVGFESTHDLNSRPEISEGSCKAMRTRPSIKFGEATLGGKVCLG